MKDCLNWPRIWRSPTTIESSELATSRRWSRAWRPWSWTHCSSGGTSLCGSAAINHARSTLRSTAGPRREMMMKLARLQVEMYTSSSASSTSRSSFSFSCCCDSGITRLESWSIESADLWVTPRITSSSRPLLDDMHSAMTRPACSCSVIEPIPCRFLSPVFPGVLPACVLGMARKVPRPAGQSSHGVRCSCFLSRTHLNGARGARTVRGRSAGLCGEQFARFSGRKQVVH